MNHDEDYAASSAKTPLYDLHRELGARMVPFAGYAMPLHYRDGILREHLHTRDRAGLFDVSHMGQIRLTGNVQALERLCPIDLEALRAGQQRYTLFTNERGGVLDDLMVNRDGDHLLLVVNAGTKQNDAEHLRRHLGRDCGVEELGERALLALQGPVAAKVLARLTPETAKLVFMTGAWFELVDTACYITRSGYTGEDGFEISVSSADAERVARSLLAHPEVAPVGLGARDSLRMEAGMCLYGHELDANTTPIEAGLEWTVARSRRADPRGFVGAETILAQLRDGVKRRRVGLLPEGKMPVRGGAELHSESGEIIGHVSSGGFSPSLSRPIAMAYVQTGSTSVGQSLIAIVRDKPVPVRVARLPFVTPRYYRGLGDHSTQIYGPDGLDPDRLSL